MVYGEVRTPVQQDGKKQGVSSPLLYDSTSQRLRNRELIVFGSAFGAKRNKIVFSRLKLSAHACHNSRDSSFILPSLLT